MSDKAKTKEEVQTSTPKSSPEADSRPGVGLPQNSFPNSPEMAKSVGNDNPHQLPDGSPRHGRDTSIPDEDRVRETQKNAVPSKPDPKAVNPDAQKTGRGQS